MYRFKSSAAIAVIIGTLLLGACATNSPEAEQTELQRSAMQRLKSCLSRNLDSNKTAAAEVSRLIGHTCEGHRRDVIVLFPPHLANQVDQMLVSRAHRYIDDLQNPVNELEERSQPVKTLLR